MKRKAIRIIAMLLTLAMLTCSFVSCGGGDDDDGKKPPKDEGDDKEMYYLTIKKLDDTSMKVVNVASGEFTSMYTEKDEEPVIYWHAKSAKSARFYNELDLSAYNGFRFSVYSENATNSKVQLRFNCPHELRPEGAGMDPYYRFYINVDFTGWKDFYVSFDDLSSNYKPTLSRIVSISFDCSGWDMVSNSDNKLYFTDIEAVKSNYEVVAPEGVDVNDPEIYKVVTANFRETLVGTPEGSTSDEYVNRVTSIANACKNRWETWKYSFKNTYQGNVRDTLFGQKVGRDPTYNVDEQKITAMYGYLLEMAQGYGTKGETNPYYHNAELLEDIKKGLEYLYQFYYGPTVWEDGVFANWWHWDIGVPLKLTSILVILEDELGVELCKKYLEPFDYLNKYPSMTACNKVWVTKCILLSAFMQRDAERILLSIEKMSDVFDYVSQGDGFYTDGSFVQHGKHSYTGGYGLSMISELTNLMYIFKGSRFRAEGDGVNNQYRWIFENFRPVMYAGNFMASMRGREVYRNTSESSANNTAVASMIKMQAYAPDEIKAELEKLIRYYMVSSGKNYVTSVPICLVDYTLALYNNTAIVPASDYYITKTFGMMDRVVHHGPKYAACVALSSTRMYKYEAINRENMDGWYLGDGMIYIYTDGYDYNYSFYNYSNPYRMPGTTVTDAPRTEENLSGGILNSSAFAGGVESGRYGIAAFDLGYAQNKYFNTTLVARKSYFMFDNEIVCVGSGISGGTGNAYTVIENRLWRSSDKLTVNGALLSTPPTSDTEVTANSMHFTNMGGYVFIGGADVTYGKIKHTVSGKSQDFLEIVQSHGANPSDGKYAYVYLPEATAEETSAYQGAPDIEILSNTKQLHAVRENKLGITGYVFYEGGVSSSDAYNVSVSSACAVMVSKGEDGSTVVNVSDPTHLLTSLSFEITVPGASSVSVTNDGDSVSYGINGNRVSVVLDVSGANGGTKTVVIK